MKNNLNLLCLILTFCCVNLVVVAQQKKQATGPYAIISGYSGVVTIKKEVLMKAEEIICSVADYKIMSFGISILLNKAYADFTCSGSVFSSQMKKIFNAVGSGQKILIEQVKARKPDGTIVSIKGMTILVE